MCWVVEARDRAGGEGVQREERLRFEAVALHPCLRELARWELIGERVLS